MSSPLDGSITLVTRPGIPGAETHPICIDWRFQLDKFLHYRLPSEDVLFARCPSRPLTNPLSCGNASEYLKPPYPPLPPIKVGELQWPTGASRYGRALYAVDWPTMRAVAEYCWGYEAELDEHNDEIIPTDVPAEWNPTDASVVALELNINGGIEGLFRAKMYPLAPYRVPGFGIDLWLLPLVDGRYRNVHRVYESTAEEPEDWKSLIEDYVGGPLASDEVPEAYGDPDPRLYKTIQPQLSAELLDVATLSIGLRMVFEPATNLLRAINAENSDKRRDTTLGFQVHATTGEVSGESSPKLIAGGKRGKAVLPSHIDAYCQRDGESIKKSHAVEGGMNFTRLPIWTTWEARLNGPSPNPPDGRTGVSYTYSPIVGTSGAYSASNLPPGLTIHSTTGEITGTPTEAGEYAVEITRGGTTITLTIVIEEDSEDRVDAFVEQIANDLAAWSNSGGQYCFVGPIGYIPSGYDDYLSIQILETEQAPELFEAAESGETTSTDYVFRSRIYELPSLFLPAVILAGGEEPDCSRTGELYRFEMTEDIESGDGGETPPTTIIKNFPKTKTVTAKAVLVNVDGMIDGARGGFKGECKYEANKYWFTQAACNQICKSAIFIPAQTPDNARINQTDYSWTPTVNGTPDAGSWAAAGLPEDWDIDADTGTITGPYSGVLGPEQYLNITITCTGPKTPPAEGTCTATRKIKLRIVGA